MSEEEVVVSNDDPFVDSKENGDRLCCDSRGDVVLDIDFVDFRFESGS